MTMGSQTIPSPKSFDFELTGGVAAITLNRPERRNSLTFESYRELEQTIAALGHIDDCRAITITGQGKGFCSGGDRDDIIAELVQWGMAEQLRFTRMTGRLIQTIRETRRPIIAAINGAAVGAGAVIATACDLRIAAKTAKFGFIFPQVGLCGADMGAAYLLPRIIGLGRASELLFFGDVIDAEEASRIGLVNRLVDTPEQAVALAGQWARKLARGSALGHSMTKQMLESEYTMPLADAIEAEAQAQAICMQHPDFETAYRAAKAKEIPRFAGADIVPDEPEPGER